MEPDIEISLEEAFKKAEEGFRFIDIRDEDAVSYGIIPGAAPIPLPDLEKSTADLKRLPGVILYCAKGLISIDAARDMRARGICAYSLKDGYAGYVMAQINAEMDPGLQREIEKGLQKRWHEKLFAPFSKAVKNYELVKEGDRIAVCISGGKDSMLMAKLFQELKRHKHCDFDLKFLVMDPGYSPENRQVIEHNARLLGIPITIFETRIFDAVDRIDKSPCYMCARMRRGYLYKNAKALGCNKIALGHHFDDVIETILMGILYSGQFQTMMPKLHSQNYEGMELIRPMYLVREADIKRWRDENGLHFIQCACHFTDTCSVISPGDRTGSKRLETKLLIAEMKKTNPYVEQHIFKSVENVYLDTIIAYKTKDKRHHFLDTYDL